MVSTTLTLAVVFLPLLFMGGMSGRLFREFGVTIAGAVLISAAGGADAHADAELAAAASASHGRGMVVREDRAVLQARWSAVTSRALERFLRKPALALLVLRHRGRA